MNSHNRPVIIETEKFGRLFAVLQERGLHVIGPTIWEGSIVFARIQQPSDLPVGWTDEQDGGTYRLKRRDDGAFFSYNQGPHSLKNLLHQPVLRLWSASRQKESFSILREEEEAPRFAFIGVRACDLHALEILDRVFLEGEYTDPWYESCRKNAFIVAVNCEQGGGTCFCASMGTGPCVESGYDLLLTEVREPGGHYFVAQSGNGEGTALLDSMSLKRATDHEIRAAENITSAAAAQMGRAMETTDIKALLYRNCESRTWNEVARRCLMCGNCTMVCPTCFCSTVEDITSIAGNSAERWRRWDSCFTKDFTYIHGGHIRSTPMSRYRQWLTHKMAAWIDQFGTSGCVGCGRCITWCPVGIDITEEVRAIRNSEIKRKEDRHGNA